MRKLIVIVLAGCALAMSQGSQKVAAHQGWTPLEELAGTYSLTFQQSLAICLANTPTFTPVPCGSPNSRVAGFTALGAGSGTFDAAGNVCNTFTTTLTASPVDASQPLVTVFNNVGHITSYDPRTGTGDKSETNYVGGQCHGTSFDSTGATATGIINAHFAVSNHGKRIDGIILPNNDPTVGSNSAFFTFLRQ